MLFAGDCPTDEGLGVECLPYLGLWQQLVASSQEPAIEPNV